MLSRVSISHLHITRHVTFTHATLIDSTVDNRSLSIVDMLSSKRCTGLSTSPQFTLPSRRLCTFEVQRPRDHKDKDSTAQGNHKRYKQRIESPLIVAIPIVTALAASTALELHTIWAIFA
eukprot:m.514944 g.514944  ORF g.514944 m.514944 type:complete len:120 (+) comp21915_c0_seq12:1586-1945(+)